MVERITSVFPELISPVLIGHGGFSNVYSAIHKQAMSKVAVKVVQKHRINSDSAMRNFKRELDIAKTLDHPFIMQYYDVKEDEYAYYILGEFATNDSLLSLVNKYGKIREEEAAKIFCQIISVIRYLHEERRIVHRDLKLENVLLTTGNWVRVIDFGFSVHLDESTSIMETRCGSFPYAAPEMFRKKPYTNAIDIWSCGIVLYILLTGKLPFNDENAPTLVHKICHDEPEYPAELSEEAVDLLKGLLLKDHNNRLTIAQISEHPWIAKSSYSCFVNKDFARQPQVRVFPESEAEIDHEVKSKMIQMGISMANFACDLINARETAAVVMYRMLRKIKISAVIVSRPPVRYGGRQFSVIHSPIRSDFPCLRGPRKPLTVLPRGNDDVNGKVRRMSAVAFVLKRPLMQASNVVAMEPTKARRMTDEPCREHDV